MRCNLLLLFVVAIGFGVTTELKAQSIGTEGSMRGEMAAPPTDNLELEATLETVKMDMIISEMEDAGFSLDVEEGFEEEWEEDIWVSADADEVEALILSPDDSELMDAEEVLLTEELTEDWDDLSWEDPAIALDESEVDSEMLDEDLMEDEELEATVWRGESEDEDVSLLAGFEEEDEWDEEETEWWVADNDGYDESWEDLQEEWEFDALEDVYESEDIEYLEMMYGMD